MILEHFAPITVPFMGQLVVFALVARVTSDYKIARIIGTATCDRNDVIDMVSFPYLFVAPITASFLALILSFDVIKRMRTFRFGLYCTAFVAVYTAQFAGVFWMFLFPLAHSFYSIFTMIFSELSGSGNSFRIVRAGFVFGSKFFAMLFAITFSLRFTLFWIFLLPFIVSSAIFFRMKFPIRFYALFDFFFVSFTITFCGIALRLSSRHITPRLVLGRLREGSRRRRNRFSGATLATNVYYTAEWGIVR